MSASPSMCHGPYASRPTVGRGMESRVTPTGSQDTGAPSLQPVVFLLSYGPSPLISWLFSSSFITYKQGRVREYKKRFENKKEIKESAASHYPFPLL